MAQPHTDIWRERRNQELGLPPGTRHTDEWYMAEMQRRASQAPIAARDQANAFAEGLKGTQDRADAWIRQQQEAAAAQQAQQEAAAQTQQQAQAQQAAAALAQQQAAAKVQQDTTEADALARKKETARRDDWDRMNQQGAYDADGWQSDGDQRTPLAMPWWWDGSAAAPTPPTPAAPAPAPTPAIGSGSPQQPGAQPNALAQLVGTAGPAGSGSPQQPGVAPLPSPWAPTLGSGSPQQPIAQPWGMSSGGQGMNWGAWGQKPSWWKTEQNPDQGMTSGAQPWMQKPSRQRNRGWGQTWGSGSPQQPGSWGSGTV